MSASKHGTHSDGMIGEGHFLAFAARQGWGIFRGVDGHEPCDYVIDTPEGLRKVEVKWIGATQRTDKNYYYCTATKLQRKEFDYLFVATPGGSYWIPASACPESTLSIKVQGELYERNITRPGKYEAYRVESI